MTKVEMYALLRAGAFGNTSPSWTDVVDWAREARPRPGSLWGLRHRRISGFPGTKLNVKAEDVVSHLHRAFGLRDYNISPMTPGTVLWEGDITEHYASGNLSPKSGTWRKHMLAPKLWEGSARNVLLRSLMNENSYDDLCLVLEAYPGHVVEVSILDCCFGTCPGRNSVVWETRDY